MVEFAGPENPRMARGDLMNEGGAGTRHSHNENRKLRRLSPSEPFSKNSCVKTVDHSVNQGVEQHPGHNSRPSTPAALSPANWPG